MQTCMYFIAKLKRHLLVHFHIYVYITKFTFFFLFYAAIVFLLTPTPPSSNNNKKDSTISDFVMHITHLSHPNPERTLD